MATEEEIKGAADRAKVRFRDFYWDAWAGWEQNGSDLQDRPWWCKDNIREVCGYPWDYPWSPLFWALHEAFGLIYRPRYHTKYRFSFPTGPQDRARMIRYALSVKIGSQRRAVRLLRAGKAPGAFQRLTKEALELESAKLDDKYQITIERALLAAAKVDALILEDEIVALIEAE